MSEIQPPERTIALHFTTTLIRGDGLSHVAVTYQRNGGQRFHAGDLLMPPAVAEVLQAMVGAADHPGRSGGPGD